jgi:hypothetical protein
MNRQLKRIEQTLHRLEKTTAPSASDRETTQSATALKSAAPTSSERSTPPAARSRAVSFQVSTAVRSEKSLPDIKLPTGAAQPVPTFVATQQPEEPIEDKFKLPTFTSPNLGFSRHQNGSNPDLALNLLQESLNLLQSWRTELGQVIRSIQEIYREGPIVDGWLECSTQKVEATTQILRTAEVAQLMGYVETLCADPTAAQAEYRLCGLSADGRTWSNPCPQSQLASISLAISRHQKLQPLLQRKLVLEKHLHQSAELAAKFHGQVQGL